MLNFLGLGNSFDIDVIAYIAVFMILWALMKFILSKTIFRESKSIVLVISASSALLALYGLIRANFSVADLMFRFGIPEALRDNLIWMIFLIVALVIIFKFGLGILLIIAGIGFFFSGVVGIVYAKTAAEILGAILFLIGVLLNRRRIHRRKLKNLDPDKLEDYKIKRRQNRLAAKQNWYNAGRKIGKPIGWTRHQIKKRNRAAKISRLKQKRWKKREYRIGEKKSFKAGDKVDF